MAPPFKTAVLDIMFNEGFSKMGDLLDTAEKMGVAEKSGAFYSYNKNRLAQGRLNSIDMLKKNPDLDCLIGYYRLAARISPK